MFMALTLKQDLKPGVNLSVAKQLSAHLLYLTALYILEVLQNYFSLLKRATAPLYGSSAPGAMLSHHLLFTKGQCFSGVKITAYILLSNLFGGSVEVN